MRKKIDKKTAYKVAIVFVIGMFISISLAMQIPAGVNDPYALKASDGTPADALYVDGNGDVGIGLNTSPASHRLHVYDNSKAQLKLERTSGHWMLLGVANDNDWAAFYTTENAFYFGREIHVDEGIISSYDEDLQLCANSNPGINNPVMRLKTNGNVGIGTPIADITHKLTVKSADDNTLRLIGPDGGGYGYGARITFGNINGANEYVYIDEYANDNLKIFAQEGIYLDAGNNYNVFIDDVLKLDPRGSAPSASGENDKGLIYCSNNGFGNQATLHFWDGISWQTL